MIDTIKLVKTLSSPLSPRVIKWQSYKTCDNGVTIGVINPTSEDRLHGIYQPNVTYYERPVMGGHTYEIGIEVSLPKLHFGNNFEELTESDYKSVIKDLKHSLRSMGFSKEFVKIIGSFEVRKIDFCKNVRYTDGTMAETVIGNLAKADISKIYDIQKTDFRNGGKIYHIHTNSRDVAFYDKISDLQQARKSEHRAIDHTPSYCQYDILKDLEEEQKEHPLSVLRYEVRLNGKKRIQKALSDANVSAPLTLKGLFKQDIARAVLSQTLDDILKKVPNCELLEERPLNLFIDILAKGGGNNRPRDVLAKLGFMILADDIGDMRKFRNIIDSNFHKDAWGRLSKAYSSSRPPKSQLKALLRLREEVVMM